MSTDPKPPKPMPSADEINAYVELSAARTKLRLPLAKGAARVATLPGVGEPAVENIEKRAPPPRQPAQERRAPARCGVLSQATKSADSGRSAMVRRSAMSVASVLLERW